MTRRSALRLACAALALGAAALPCRASTLRGMTSLATSTVRVADLFDDTGAAGARVLGPAPAPGARIVIEAAQLAAIARQFGVDWRPASAGDRVVLERPGRLLARAGVMDVLRTALAGVGAPTDAEIEVPGFAAPMVGQDTQPEIGIEQVEYDAASGRFTALMLVTGADVETQRMRLSGRVDAMVGVMVPARRLAAGALIAADDLRPARVRATTLHGDVVQAADQAVGQTLRHAGFPGQPIMLADVARPSDVHKGDRVAIELSAPGLALSARGLAMENGATGDRIAVLNPVSRAIFDAEILGAGRVRVRPGSLPLAPPANIAAVLAER